MRRGRDEEKSESLAGPDYRQDFDKISLRSQPDELLEKAKSTYKSGASVREQAAIQISAILSRWKIEATSL